MPYNSDKENISVKLHHLAYKKLDKLAKQEESSKKRMLETLVSIGLRLSDRLGGYFPILTDERLKIKFYFEEDPRTEIEF